MCRGARAITISLLALCGAAVALGVAQGGGDSGACSREAQDAIARWEQERWCAKSPGEC